MTYIVQRNDRFYVVADGMKQRLSRLGKRAALPPVHTAGSESSSEWERK